jgi:hypothetical protein
VDRVESGPLANVQGYNDPGELADGRDTFE